MAQTASVMGIYIISQPNEMRSYRIIAERKYIAPSTLEVYRKKGEKTHLIFVGDTLRGIPFIIQNFTL